MGLTATLERRFLRLHQFVYVRTDGRVGQGLVPGACSLLLRTTGRRTGLRRTNALIYAMDAGSYVVVASNSARAESPGWYFNLCADPRVELQVGCKRIAGLALALQEGELDYDRLWRLVNDGNRGRYDGYRRRTTRPIPLVVVQPV